MGCGSSTSPLDRRLNDTARNTNNVKAIRDLVTQGADLASTNGCPWHHTPLHQACFHNRPEIVAVLLELGSYEKCAHLASNPCGRGGRGLPIELARGGGHHKIVSMLEEYSKSHFEGAMGKIDGSGDGRLDGHYFSFRTGGNPSEVVDRFEARQKGENRVTYYRNGQVGCKSRVNSATAHAMESYEIRGNQLHGPVSATIQPNGDIQYSHGYTSRKEAGGSSDTARTNSIGKLEFLGLWKDTTCRAMPIKMQVRGDASGSQIRVAFESLLADMQASGHTTGILACQSCDQMHWSVGNDESYKKHGYIGMGPPSRSSWSRRVHSAETLTFDGFEGKVYMWGGDWQNAVYRVTLTEETPDSKELREVQAEIIKAAQKGDFAKAGELAKKGEALSQKIADMEDNPELAEEDNGFDEAADALKEAAAAFVARFGDDPRADAVRAAVLAALGA